MQWKASPGLKKLKKKETIRRLKKLMANAYIIEGLVHSKQMRMKKISRRQFFSSGSSGSSASFAVLEFFCQPKETKLGRQTRSTEVVSFESHLCSQKPGTALSCQGCGVILGVHATDSSARVPGNQPGTSFNRCGSVWIT